MEILGLTFIVMVFIFWSIFVVSKAMNGQSRITNRKRYKYWLKTDIMTPTERTFYKTLIQLLGSEYFVFPQIRLSSLLNEKVKGQSWKAALWRINQKSVDYVVCHVETLKPVFAIELDDYTHDSHERMQRDADVEQIFASVDFPLLRIKVGTPSEEVAVVLQEALRR
ncbi:MAG: hypothetical protein QG549_302 [Patescibacteria group bacterium]|nr:hypothetical protein [Patescibacteria group bacterium]